MRGSRVVFPERGRAAVEAFELPALAPGQVLIENEYTVISAGTERANLLAMPNTPGRYPQYPGYCGVGRVVARASDVAAPAEGARVLVYHGGHGSHCVLKAEGLVEVPEAADPLEASFMIIASMSLQGVRKTRPELGESGMVIGQGLLGLFATQLMRLSGLLPVAALDLDPARRSLALELGADMALDPQDPDLEEVCRDRTQGRLFQAIVEVTGASSALPLALRLAARQGRVSLLGCTRVSDTPIDFYQLVHKPGVSIIGAHNYVRPEHESSPFFWTRQDDYRALLNLLAAKRLAVRPMISGVHAPGEAPDLYAKLAQDPCAPLGRVFDWRRAAETLI